MNLTFDEASLIFAFDEELDQTVCRAQLEAWTGFSSENSRAGCESEHVIFILEPTSYETHPDLAPAERYQAALAWLLAHQAEARDTVLRGIMSFIETMRSEYGICDEELDAIDSAAHLTNKVDLSFVRIFPHSKAGVPYLGFELECNWDPEHGCGVLIRGTTVVDAGVSDSAQSICAIEDDGGAVWL